MAFHHGGKRTVQAAKWTAVDFSCRTRTVGILREALVLPAELCGKGFFCHDYSFWPGTA